MEKEFIRFNSGKRSTWCTVERNKQMGSYFVYIFKCENDKFYCGVTRNIIRRIVEHLTGKNDNDCWGRFTKKNYPLQMVHLEKVDSYLDAINLETEIWKILKNNGNIQHCVMKEYIGIFQMIQELLKDHHKTWVIKKLTTIEKGG